MGGESSRPYGPERLRVYVAALAPDDMVVTAYDGSAEVWSTDFATIGEDAWRWPSGLLFSDALIVHSGSSPTPLRGLERQLEPQGTGWESLLQPFYRSFRRFDGADAAAAPPTKSHIGRRRAMSPLGIPTKRRIARD